MEMNKLNVGTAAFPLAVIGIIAIMVVPMPSFVLDILLSINIAAGVLVLLSTLNATRVLDLASFPSILLLATLFRLGLNVSTTRQILGSGTAGSVITSFGQSVVGGSLVVGLIVFMILVIIQFVVITNGSSRVSEVAARFTLDAMPGKQMAIDADLNAGLLTEAEARTRRTEIAREADFFGAMDGASKFVKGDAAAGLIITAVNLIGGLAVGMTSLGLTATEALDRFAMLTIGDGLVSQIPALLISIAAGIAVTRSSATEDDLGSAVVEEFSRQKRAFQLSGVALAALGALPGLPFIPFALVGGILIALSVRLKTTEAVETVAEEDEPAPDLDSHEVLVRDIRVEPLSLELANDMLDLVDPATGGDLLDRIRGLRRKIAFDYGLLMPTVRTTDNSTLPAGTYRICVHGVEAAQGVAPPGKIMVIDDDLSRWPGETVTEVVFGLDVKWIPASFRAAAESAGATVVDRSAVITTHLGEVVTADASHLLGRQDVKELVDHVKETDPAVIEDLVGVDVPMTVVQWVFRDLLDEGISIRDSVRILETIAGTYRQSSEPTEVAERVREVIGPSICSPLLHEGRLPVINLEPVLEHELIAALATNNGSDVLTAESLQTVVADICDIATRAQAGGVEPVLIVNPHLRRALAELLKKITAAPRVLSFAEVPHQIQVTSTGTVSLPIKSIEGGGDEPI